ncbi:hypothetical protein TNCV_893911 [Trichonephila clavipes]|nr:hypothetical protein TNCV_893911 [Trichonephila clavipes]
MECRLQRSLQGSSESVQEFAARINKLGTQIFQSSNSVLTTAAGNVNDQLLQSRFISGLRNDIRRFELARDPISVEKSVKEGHRLAEGRKRIAEQRPWNSPRFRRSVRDETPVSRSSRIEPANHRRVRFEDSIPRRFPPVSQTNFRDVGNAGGFRQNRMNENLNCRGESQYYTLDDWVHFLLYKAKMKHLIYQLSTLVRRTTDLEF